MQKNHTASVIRADVCQEVNNKIIAALESGTKPWVKPWDGGNLPNIPLRYEGTQYRGINVLILWLTAAEQGFASPCWITYRQAQALKAQVRKGERGTRVVYYGVIECDDDEQGNEKDNEKPKVRRFLKTYTVFNADQIDGLPERFHEARENEAEEIERRIDLETFVKNTGATIHEAGTRAFYRLDQDIVVMPPFPAFHSADHFYATLAHELGHWTRHETRLNRDFGRKRWGDEGYAMEELVAELGAAFLGAEFGFSPSHIDDHAAYIKSWLKVLKEDKRAIFTAAAHAQTAADFLLKRGGWSGDSEEERVAA